MKNQTKSQKCTHVQCDEEYIPKVIMIYVDENLPQGDEAPQFTHRNVLVQRPRDVHADFETLEEIGRQDKI